MIIIEYDYLAFLKHSRSDLNLINESLKNTKNDIYTLIPDGVEDAFLKSRSIKLFSLSRNLNQTIDDFAHIGKELLNEIKTKKITHITFYSFPLIWIHLINDLINLEVDFKIYAPQPQSFLPKMLITDLLPFAYEHALLYLKNTPHTYIEKNFVKFDLQLENVLESFTLISNGNNHQIECSLIQKTLKTNDVIVLSKNDNINLVPLSSLKNQDVSLHLYRPLIQKNDIFLIKKVLLESLTSDERELMKNDPNYFLYIKNINTAVSLESLSQDAFDDKSFNLTSEHSYASFENTFFHLTKTLYQNYLGLK